ncbi:hypothetical protein D0Z67_29420 (plasmid) [Streptomyces seoulensis]|uniref:Uncharacterized protein n=1 Tax=Streptomyces seoulensis TaxID=73044 RepID=A0A4P6U3H1_STRSO|nr:hypothetical protein [Streptomyces seoulensis]QBJ94490.1 hypothetical protein D0Z67_29420 [Streptomyces seoulensis]
MAASMLTPYEPAADEISVPEALLLFAETGHPIARETLVRQCKLQGVELNQAGRGRPVKASWSDLLVVHARWVDSR